MYLAFCPGGRVAGQCKANEEYANPTTYSAMRDSQTVVYRVWGTAPRRYGECAVRDAWNWSCPRASAAEQLSYVQMVDGLLDERFGRPPNDELFYQVPKWHWWLLHLTSRQ